MEKVRVQIQKQTAVFVMARSEIAFLCRTLCTWCTHLRLCGFKKCESGGEPEIAHPSNSKSEEWCEPQTALPTKHFANI